jgi:hypothetical protein
VTPRWWIAVAFALVLAGAAAVEVGARRPGAAVRTLGATVAAALRTRAGRAVVFGLWLWLGWHFLAR